MAPRLRDLIAVTALSASALMLTACVQSPPEPLGANPTPTSSASSTPSASPTPSAAASTDPQATAVKISCSELISPQAMYDFNPNFLLLNNFSPAAGSFAATALTAQGVACRWQNSTSGVTIDVSVAKPAPAKLESIKSTAGSAADGFNGYFAVNSGTGTAQVFTGGYWATLSSEAFFEAGDVGDLVADVRSALL
ncbi:MAG: arginyl-tRNA synthetase [Rhodoglobus sp.]